MQARKLAMLAIAAMAMPSLNARTVEVRIQRDLDAGRAISQGDLVRRYANSPLTTNGGRNRHPRQRRAGPRSNHHKKTCAKRR